MKDIRFKTYENSLLKEKYYKYTHICGLDIYVFPKKLSSTYAILGTRYGSIDNCFGITDKEGLISVPDGIAHFLEHKLFANEDGSDSFEHFSAFGADANAYTDYDKTAYLFSCTDNFSESLTELIEFVTHPYFTEEAIKRECGIIAQEIKMYEDNPAESCYCGMLGGLYGHHSIRKNICGTLESISKITPELLYECYRVFYNPSNMALIVCGDVELADVIKIADKHLPKEATSADIIRSSQNALEAPSVFSSRVSKKMKVAKPLFNIGIKDIEIPHDPKERQKKDVGMSILNEILFSRSGVLYTELFESGLISPDISYCYTINSSFAFNSISGKADDPETVIKRISQHIKDSLITGISREDFERGKRVIYAEFIKEFDSTEGIANNLLSFTFDSFDIFEYIDVISDIDFEYVSNLFSRAFKDEFFTMSVVYPIDQ